MCLLDVCLWQDVWELQYVNMTTIQNAVVAYCQNNWRI